jgi:hypothetical protein
MFDKKELAIIIVSSIVVGFIVSNFQTSRVLGYSILSILLIVTINSIVKKIAGYHFESEVKINLWEIQRFGWRPESKFKNPMPAGILLPILFKLISWGKINWLAFLTFDVEAKVSRAAKRHDIYTFSELSEYHLGVIAAWGIAANLLFAAIGYLLELPPEMNFVNLSLAYALFNMLPISDLDGNKIFFGSITLWSFLAAIILLVMLFSFLAI